MIKEDGKENAIKGVNKYICDTDSDDDDGGSQSNGSFIEFEEIEKNLMISEVKDTTELIDYDLVQLLQFCNQMHK